MIVTSVIAGTFSSCVEPVVRSDAAISFNAEFFAPCKETVPDSAGD